MAYQTAWRITSARFTKEEAFNGEGGMISGGRWHEKGHRIVYTSENLALATLETYIHLNHLIHVKKFNVYKVEIPAQLIHSPELSVMAEDTGTMAISKETQVLGTKWLDGRSSAVLAVPSVIVPLEKNFLLNPDHHDFKQLIIHDALDHRYDPRL